MIKVKEIIMQFEFKITIVFACIVLFLVFLLGLINHVDIGIIIKRIIISEIFFIPMGFFITHILKVYVFNNQKMEYLQSTSEIQENNIKESYQEESLNSPSVEKSNIKISEEAESRSNDSKDTYKDTGVVNKVIIDDKDINDIPLDTPIHQEFTTQDELKKLNELSKDSLGKHIIINNKKIINDPKIMAEAVRTMMNKEE